MAVCKLDLKAWCEDNFPRKIRWNGDDGITNSPLREDKNPSFTVSLDKRCWHDLATDDRGTFTALAQEMGWTPPPWEPEHRTPTPPRKEEPKPDRNREIARKLWAAAKTDPAKDHPYLVKKGVPAYDGCRVIVEGRGKGTLLVPAFDLKTGELSSVCRVAPAPDKSGKWPKPLLGKVKGAAWIVGSPTEHGPVILAEGPATAATVKGFVDGAALVACVFSASNFATIAALMQEIHPGREIVMAVDGDKAGLTAYERVAKRMPVVCCAPERGDWNDLAQEIGMDAAREIFGSTLEKGRANVKPVAEEEERVIPEDVIDVVAKDQGARCLWYRLPDGSTARATFDEANKESFLRGCSGDPLTPTKDLRVALWTAVAAAPAVTGQTWGPGVHKVKDGFLIVSGNKAAHVVGQTVTVLSRPVYGGRMVDLTHGNRWIDLEALAREMASPVALEAATKEMIDFMDRWNWQSPDMGTFAAALILSLPLAGTWETRPWIFLTGKRGAGKTVLLDQIGNLWGSLAARSDKATEASLRNDVGNTGRVAVLDEFEKSRHMGSILEMLKLAARGGFVTRAGRSGQTYRWELRTLALFAGVMVPRKITTDAAAASRSVVMELLPNDGGGVPSFGPLKDQPLRAARFMAAVLSRWAEIERRHDEIVRRRPEEYGVKDIRTVENVAYLLALLEVATKERAALPAFVTAGETVSDEANILDSIMGAIIRDPSRGSMAVASLIDEARGPGDQRPSHTIDLLQSHGLSLIWPRGGDDKALAIHAPTVARYLLKDMPELSQADVTGVLRRIEGASYRPVKFGSALRKCVVLPLALAFGEPPEGEVTKGSYQVTNRGNFLVTSGALANTGFEDPSYQVTKNLQYKSCVRAREGNENTEGTTHDPSEISLSLRNEGNLVTSPFEASDTKGSASYPPEVTSEVTKVTSKQIVTKVGEKGTI